MMFSSKTLQIRMSQAYRMGFQDHFTSPNVSRLFIKKYIPSATGQYETGHTKKSVPEMAAEIKWNEELAKIQANLKSHGIKWNETSQPFITVKGTAQVHIKEVIVRSNVFISGLSLSVFSLQGPFNPQFHGNI